MTLLTLVRRSFQHYLRAHAGALLGAGIATAVLVGALLVGDSVRASLKEMGLARLAGAAWAIRSGDRFFRADLAERVQAKLGGHGVAASALSLEGLATSNQGAGRANHVQVLGVSAGFAGESVSCPGDGEVWLNEGLARQLGVAPGQEIILRVRKPSALSRDTIITPRSDSSFALRLRYTAPAPPQLATFQLRASQLPPLNAFVHRDALQKAAGLAERANLLLVRPTAAARETALDDTALRRALQECWSLADAELVWRQPTSALLELTSRRIFLDPALSEAARGLAGPKPVQVLTYLVNELRHGEKAAPYSMVTATDGPQVPADLRDDEVVINQWLAQDLGLAAGDSLQVAYYVLDSVRSLAERTESFRVRAVVPMEGVYDDRSLMPEFPGLSKAESTHDWDAGFELVHPIRPQDEAYWKAHRGTPKAFVSLAAGQRLWGNRFGDLTGLRFPLGPSEPGVQAGLERTFLERLAPERFGLRWESVRAEALRAATTGQDFGGLFIGFSFFLVTAALLLMSLLFHFSMELRAMEVGTLLALGFPPRRVRRLLLVESALVAGAGSLAGAVGAVFYAQAMLRGLTTIWRDAVGTTSLTFHATPFTLAGGVLISWAVAWLTMWLALRQQGRLPIRVLLAEGSPEALAPPGARPAQNQFSKAGLLCGALAIGLAAWSAGRPAAQAPLLFFGAGACLLLAGLTQTAQTLRWVGQATITNASGQTLAPRLTLGSLSLRNAARRRRRSLAIVALLACGSFLVTSLGVFRLDAVRDAHLRASGTGGFALIGESSLPLTQDLNQRAGRQFLGLSDQALPGVEVVGLRVQEGDDASCLNLNRAQRPRLLGIAPAALATRRAFTLTGAARGLDPAAGWRLLQTETRDTNVIPAMGDANSIQWALGRQLGDELAYEDENGRPFRIRLVGAVANSILQGQLLVDEQAFVRRFPSVSGYRMFLIDAPSDRVSEVSSNLTRALSDYGMELTPASQRLAAFNAVQNTYLGTFQILGGLGLVLGSAGLGVVVLRHVLARRSELALLLAVGFRRNRLERLVLTEHAFLLLTGLFCGVAAAAVAVLPAILTPGGAKPGASLAITLAAVCAHGLFWTWLATRWAVRGRLPEALRQE